MSIASFYSTEGPLAGQRFPMRSPVLLGRGIYNHVVLDDVRVSRQHAKISLEAGDCVIYDLNSENGTFVNGTAVRRAVLREGDEIVIGPFWFRCEGGAASLPRPGDSSPEHDSMAERRTHHGLESLPGISARPWRRVVMGMSEMEDAHWRLRALRAFGQSLGGATDPASIVDHVCGSLLDAFRTAETVALYLPDPGSGQLLPRSVRSRKGTRADELWLPPWVPEEVMTRGRSILVGLVGAGGPGGPGGVPASPADSGPSGAVGRPGPDGAGHATGSAMYAQLLYQDQGMGLIYVEGGDLAARFTQADLELLVGMAGPAALALQNAQMHQQALRQQRLNLDLVYAEQIQKSFLPMALPDVSGVLFATEYLPAYQVGGDFFDVFWTGPRQLGIFIGDVSGKGVSAALLMARITSDLRIGAHAAPDYNTPAAALAHAHAAVLARRQHHIFFTALYLTLDVDTGQVVMANAGHLPPLLRRGRDGALLEVEGAVGPAAGILDGVEYEASTFRLDPGDSLVLYTDGVVEATDRQGRQFGSERLRRTLVGSGAHLPAPREPREIAERIVRAVRAHEGGAPATDDITLVVLARSQAAAGGAVRERPGPPGSQSRSRSMRRARRRRGAPAAAKLLSRSWFV